MASAYPPSAASAPPSHRAAANRPPPTVSNAPSGTFLPGTKVQVGSHRVVIEKYFSEGGFAHVYTVKVPRDNHKHELAVLKRVAVPDRDHLANMRTEVETMKKLKGHKHVVTYMDSHASQLKGGGYEVFLLMEYCAGGGLIDFMNTRLQHRLTEPEILKIFGDVAEGVACMHYLKPPLLHRDLKVENVLISKSSSSGTPIYKLCDFGSTASPRPAAKTADEGRLIEEDVQKHTTMQYRSPEMLDVWRKRPIDEKADIWALGVFLYKLCYYTTPFEDVGQMAILNASYKFPSYPSFSERLKQFISWMLKEDSWHRPNIYQVVKEACSMRGREVPIKDIYANRTQSEQRSNETLPSADPPKSPPSIGLQKEAPRVQVQNIPDVAPMRRGRPTAPAQQAAAKAKEGASPARGDPFAALDSKNYDVRSGAVDDLSKRFPSLDEFAIAHDNSGQFNFPQSSPRQSVDTAGGNLNERVTQALADEVFQQPQPKTELPKSRNTASIQQPKKFPERTESLKAESREISQEPPLTHRPVPERLHSGYKSTGVGASPPTSATKNKFPEISSRPVWKVPDQGRATSQPRASESAEAAAASLHPSLPPSKRPALLNMHRSKSQTATEDPAALKQPKPSRSSIDAQRNARTDASEELTATRTVSSQARSRPSSMYVSSNLDYLRDQEASKKRPSLEMRRSSKQVPQDPGTPVEEKNIDDNIAYLRSSEENSRLPSRSGSGHKKRSSLQGAKNFVGRFGDAFKRFEHNPASAEDSRSPEQRPFTPEQPAREEEPQLLSPIQGSEATATPSKYSDLDSNPDETEELPPEMRRELERRRLSQEEKRVAEKAREHKTQGGIPSRASTIQKRVQSLLDEGQRQPEISQQEVLQSSPAKAAPPTVARKPPTVMSPSNPYAQVSAASTSAPLQQPGPRSVSRPSVPPKSNALRTGGSISASGNAPQPASKAQWPPPPGSPNPENGSTRPATASKPAAGLAALLAKDMEGVPEYPPRGSSANALQGGVGGSEKYMDDSGNEQGGPDLDDFSRRYPAIEGEGEGSRGRGLKVREV